MDRRFLMWTALVAAPLVLAGLLGLDRALATTLHGSVLVQSPVFVSGNDWLDVLTLKAGSSNRLGAIVALAGVIVVQLARGTRAGKVMVLTGLVSLATAETVRALKDLFGRLRPYQVFERGEWSDAWFAGGVSFPSGHSGYYFGLALPLAAAYPRARLPLLVAPVFIALARIDQEFHYLSDVSMSVLIVCAFAYAASHVHDRWHKTPPARVPQPVTADAE